MKSHPIYLTRAGYIELEAELQYLRTSRRAELAENIHSTIDEGGDLLENTAYQEAKTEQAWVEGRIEYLETLLSNVLIIEDSEELNIPDVIHLNSIVTVQEHGQPSETFRIVGTAEADPMEGTISDASPLGKALVGKHVGDQVTVHTPDGDIDFVILAISIPVS